MAQTLAITRQEIMIHITSGLVSNKIIYEGLLIAIMAMRLSSCYSHYLKSLLQLSLQQGQTRNMHAPEMTWRCLIKGSST